MGRIAILAELTSICRRENSVWCLVCCVCTVACSQCTRHCLSLIYVTLLH